MNGLSLKVNKGDLESQGRVGWDDWWESLSTVSVIWWASQFGFTALFHLDDALVPPLDDLADSNLALEWLVPFNGRIENGSVS